MSFSNMPKLPIAQQGAREVAVGQLQHRHVAEVAFQALEGEGVFVAAAGFELPRQRQRQSRLADVVERDVGQRDVFFEHRRVATPLGQALAVDQAGVTDAQHVGGGHRVGEGAGGSAVTPGGQVHRAHMWSTSAGSL